ncbi:MAG: UDP-N-acetylmuramoyl-L-alanine--D-glutamate ligase [Sphingomonadales bacterium]
MITSETWRGKRYAVLGLARSGRATVDALLASGAEVVAWDSDTVARDALKPLPFRGGVGVGPINNSDALVPADSPHPNPSPEGEGLFDPLTLDLTGFAGVVVSPGVPLNRHPIAGHAAKYGVPVIGDIELFAQARAELPPHKVVGITGTNGKSTTTALVHHILKTAGVPTTMGGNIGLPILGQDPLSAGGVYVLELSSYQIDLTYTLDCDVAVLLNITPDHLDRYDGFEAYAASKARLFKMQSQRHSAVFAGEDRMTTALCNDINNQRRDSGLGLTIWVETDFEEDLGVSVFDGEATLFSDHVGWQRDWPTLQGPHNARNVSAAIGCCHLLAVSNAVIGKALQTYPGLPHRMERVRDLNGVLFVNDSKATNPTSTAPALAAYPAIRWILGGQAKTAELDACLPHFGHVRSAYTIGEAAGMFADLLRPHMAVEVAGTLDVAVAHAARDARAGETVLLSPACASFDQFKNFEDRGDRFRQLVGAL